MNKEITRGIDISSRRLDDLEKDFLKEIISGNNRDVILDLGCGEGNIGISAAFLNKDVYMYDINDYLERINILKENFVIKKIEFLKIDLKNVDYKTFPKNISFVYSGRFLHYLKYSEAENLIKVIFKNLKEDGKIFISVTGINTAIAEGYNKNKKIENRFFNIEKKLQKRFSIKEKVTLYSKEELKKLFDTCGFNAEKVWENDFGNIKGVFSKK